MSGPVVVATERLTLRAVTFDDLDLLIALNADVEVMAHLTGRPATVDETARELERAIGSRWIVSARDGDDFLGWIGAPTTGADEYDIGWRFRRTAWGHGYATEAAAAIIGLLVAGGAVRISAQTMAVNRRSRAVMERLGMRHVRTVHLEFDDPLPGTELGEVIYELTFDGRVAAEPS